MEGGKEDVRKATEEETRPRDVVIRKLEERKALNYFRGKDDDESSVVLIDSTQSLLQNLKVYRQSSDESCFTSESGDGKL